jgi:hypothetical protein
MPVQIMASNPESRKIQVQPLVIIIKQWLDIFAAGSTTYTQTFNVHVAPSVTLNMRYFPGSPYACHIFHFTFIPHHHLLHPLCAEISELCMLASCKAYYHPLLFDLTFNTHHDGGRFLDTYGHIQSFMLAAIGSNNRSTLAKFYAGMKPDGKVGKP